MISVTMMLNLKVVGMGVEVAFQIKLLHLAINFLLYGKKYMEMEVGRLIRGRGLLSLKGFNNG